MKLLKFTLIILLATYLVIALYYYFLQKKFIFYPTKTYTPPPKHLNIEEVYITTADDEQLHGWWMTPLDSSPHRIENIQRGKHLTGQATNTVLFFHGNAGNLTDRAFRLEIFNKLGLNALIIDYRGYGKSSGKIKKEQDLYIDGLAAWEFLTKDKNIAEENIILWGRSLGGGVACELAQNQDVSAVILEATFYSLPELARHYYWYLPVRTLLRFKFENGAKIKNIKAPILIIHSKQDDITPFAQGEKLFQTANEPKQFLKLIGGHNSDVAESYEIYLRGVRDFLKIDDDQSL
ncbi:alpha/beta hydrolase [Candidatus Parcubacteria bacterium]|nr:alpha/beta hydrolase [Candidatus Parcubacteria bacterium]